MKGLKRFLISFFGLAAIVPWGFTVETPSLIWGLPGWALYSLITTFAYAALIAVLIQIHWKTDEPGR